MAPEAEYDEIAQIIIPSIALELRPSVAGDQTAIEALVRRVVSECYGHLLADCSADPTAAWEQAWVAELAGQIVGVMLTDRDWLEDLWILKSARGLGIGSRLLALAEQQIAARGHRQARLRVVAENAAALRFYDRHGWREQHRYGHERHGFEMVQMGKTVAGSAPGG